LRSRAELRRDNLYKIDQLQHAVSRQNPNRGRNGAGAVVGKIDDEGSRFGARSKDNTASPRFPAAIVVSVSQFSWAAVPFRGIGADTGDSSSRQTMEEKACFTYFGM
jgi:hypothetical protein